MGEDPPALVFDRHDPAWAILAQGACVASKHPDRWFDGDKVSGPVSAGPVSAGGAPTRKVTGAAWARAMAKAVCGSCAVQVECLEFAQVNGIGEGIWGGLTSSERDALLWVGGAVADG